MTDVLTHLEFHLKIPDNSASKVLAAHQVLGSELYWKRTKENGKHNSVDPKLFSEQVRILSPISPPDIMEAFEDKLVVYAAKIFTELMDTFGRPCNSSKTKTSP